MEVDDVGVNHGELVVLFSRQRMELLHEIDHLNGILFIDRASRDEQKKAEHTLKLLKKKEAKLEEQEKDA